MSTPPLKSHLVHVGEHFITGMGLGCIVAVGKMSSSGFSSVGLHAMPIQAGVISALSVTARIGVRYILEHFIPSPSIDIHSHSLKKTVSFIAGVSVVSLLNISFCKEPLLIMLIQVALFELLRDQYKETVHRILVDLKSTLRLPRLPPH